MQFQVPQFIEIEDKIFGPLSFRQFVFVAGGVGLSFLAHIWLPAYLEIFVLPAIGALAIALAFFKFNNRSFVLIMEAAFKFFFSRRLYLWQKRPPTKKTEQKEIAQINPKIALPDLSTSRLKDLAWSLDVKENIHS